MIVAKFILLLINKIAPFNKYQVAFLLRYGQYKTLLHLLKKQTASLDVLILSIYGYLGLKDYNSAKTVLKEIAISYPQYVAVDLHFIQAYLFLIENKKALAIEKYLTLVQHKNFARSAKKILKLLKENDDVQKILLQYTQHSFFLPPIKKYTHLWLRFYCLIFLGALSIFLFFFILVWGINFQTPKQQSKSLTENLIVFKPNKTKVNLKDHYFLEHSNKDKNNKSTKQWATEIQANEKFKKMKEYLYQKKINSAIITYNQIMQYKLTLSLIEQFNILYKSIPLVDFHHFKNTYPLKNIFSTNYTLYLNTYIKYQGIISNVKYDRQITTFFFTIVKQEDNDVQDIVEVYVESKDLKLKTGSHYQLLGRVKGYAKNKKKIIIEGLILSRIKSLPKP